MNDRNENHRNEKLCCQVKAALQDLDQLTNYQDHFETDSWNSRDLQKMGESRSQLDQLQSRFQSIVTEIAEADIELAVEQRLRPLQTESHRRLRLLSLELAKLPMAKQPETLARSQSNIQDHLTQLQRFLQAMADDLCNFET